MTTEVPCVICRRPVNIASRQGWSRKVTGWEEGRSSGGANKITKRQIVPDSYAHTSCVRFNPRGDQEAMDL